MDGDGSQGEILFPNEQTLSCFAGLFCLLRGGGRRRREGRRTTGDLRNFSRGNTRGKMTLQTEDLSRCGKL